MPIFSKSLLPVNFQCVIDKPDPVNLVMPPNTTKEKTHIEQKESHTPNYFL